MHNTNENQGANTTNNNYTDNPDNANWTVLTEASSEFEAEVIAEAIRARGVNAIAVSLPPPMLPTNASHITGQAVVMVDKPDMHEAALALEDAKQSRIEDEEQHHQHPANHNSPNNNNHPDDPYQTSTQADYERRKQRRAGRAARYAIRLVAIFAILILAAFNPPLAAILLIALLVVEVFLLISAIQQANNANDNNDNHNHNHNTSNH